MFYLLGMDRSSIYKIIKDIFFISVFLKLYRYILCSPFNGTYLKKRKVYENLHIESGFSVKVCIIGAHAAVGLESRPSSPIPQ